MILKRNITKINRIEEVDEVKIRHIAHVEDLDAPHVAVVDVVVEEIEDVAGYATTVNHHPKIHNGIQTRRCTIIILILITQTYDIGISKAT